jgi:glycosyltransferase involved in cell wall biosynthesis
MGAVSRPVRVLFVIDELDVGGTEQQILELVKRLDRRYHPMVCCFRPGRVSREIERAGIPVFVFRKRGKVDLRLVWALRRLMRRERVDLVQTYLFTANTWARLAAILARVPIIVSSERNVDIWESGYKRLLGRWLDRWTQCTVANSEAVKTYLVGKGLPDDKTRVIHNGVDWQRFTGSVTSEATKAELGIPPHHAVVGLLARLEPQKDPRTFLRAAARLAEAMPAVSFLVVGGGSLEADLRRMAGELGLGPRTVFTGPRRDVSELLAVCDVSVMSSLKEGMSNTIMESMAAGKPVVATRVGGNPELIDDGVTGFLVPTRDPARLAAAIHEVLADPPRAKAMGLKGRARITERFSADAMVEATERLYDELGGARRPRSAAASPPAAPGERPIALVVSQFPRYVDAYFLREIAGLAARGIHFRILSLREFDGKVIHDIARPFLPDTTYVPFFFSRRILLAQLWALARCPGRYLRALATVIAGSWRRPRALARTVAVFPKSVYFARLVAEEKIAHIHANWATHPATSAWIMSRLTGVPFSFAGHASDIYLDRTMLADKIRAAKFVATCTRFNKQYLAALAGAGAADRIVVSYHGVDLERFRPAPRRAGPFRILAVGTIITCKGFDDLIEACGILAGKNVPFECAIVGDGAERRRLERLIERLELADRVSITGYVSQEALVPLYQQASVVALPAIADAHFGIPNVLLEALAVETPVVCTKLPSMPEMMEDGVQGLYVPERAPEALAAALEALARDPARGRAMGEAGRRTVQALFDTEKNIAVLEQALRAAARGDAAPAAPREKTELEDERQLVTP